MKKLLFVFLLLGSLSGFSQIGGTNTYEFLNVPVSARAGALGGNIIAVKDNDPTLSFTNPSLLNAEMNGMLTLSYLNYFSDINHGYFSYIKDFKKAGTFSGGLRYIDYGTFIETDEGGNELGKFTAGEYAFVIGWGKSIDSLFSVGANFKTIYSSLYTYTSVGVAMDFSGTYYNKNNGLTVAAVIKNVGTQMKPYVEGGEKEPLPFEIQLGISKKLKHMPFRASLDLTHIENWNLAYNDSTIVTNNNEALTDEEKTEKNKTGVVSEVFRHVVLGGEFVPSKSFNVRFGFNFRRRSELALDNKPGLVGFSWGFGVRIKTFYVSYGSARYHLAGSSNHFTISTNLSDYYKKGTAAPKQPKEKKSKDKKSKKSKKEKKDGDE
jgi:hypothetical protein